MDFGANPDLLHIGISELQALLFKTALLLGVEVLFHAEFSGTAWSGEGWDVRVARLPGDPISPGAPEALRGVAVLLGADGLGCGVGQAAGITAVELGSLRAEDAIGLVCNFAPLSDAKQLRSFSMARQFYGPLFQRLSEATGAELENIVYTKSKASHYFVMTPTRRCLIDSGVVKDPALKPLLGRENVDRAALDALVRRIAAFPFKPEQPTLEATAKAGDVELQYADQGPQLFDFSKLRRASDGIVFQEPPTGSEDALLVAVVGDALLEPFWPEGLGVVRGFLSVLDVSSAILTWNSGGSQEQTKEDFAAAFAQLKSLGAATRGNILRQEESGYALAPQSRYRAMSSTSSRPRASSSH